MATLTAYPLLALVALAVVVVAFFIGAVNPASIIAKVLGKDLSQGSGNPGATNAGRVMGRKWGVLVGVLDVLKGVVPVWIVGVTLGLHLAYLAGVAAVLGHIFSPFLRGRGGKGVATALGAVLAVHPLGAL
ncbi:MAG: glycerol-3-phosphate acyltransferase, partial [Dermatophilaceae bacterium]|nr:glycerol-3-phosphate acyltransferase [Dermatophilaceae bacterium]